MTGLGPTASGNWTVAGGEKKKSPAFAVVRFVNRARRLGSTSAGDLLRRVHGIYDLKVDPLRNTIHILYDGNPETVHRLCMRICDTGLDVVACMTADGAARFE